MSDANPDNVVDAIPNRYHCKRVDHAVCNMAFMVDDMELFTAVSPGEQWDVELTLHTIGSELPGILCGFDVPEGTILRGPATVATRQLDDGVIAYRVRLGLTVGNIPGTVQFRWAQSDPGPEITRVLTGSSLRLSAPTGGPSDRPELDQTCVAILGGYR